MTFKHILIFTLGATLFACSSNPDNDDEKELPTTT